jgi:hypothetical protein
VGYKNSELLPDKWKERSSLLLRYFFITVVSCSSMVCRKPYEPPPIKANYHFLSIDGVINTGVFSSSTFKITRSVSLLDTLPYLPELNAQVQIQSSNGNVFPLSDTGASGMYLSLPLSLDISQKYQLSVITSDGNRYLSDFVTPQFSPPIDSITWHPEYDPSTGNMVVNIYASTHDETNKIHLYRWDYTETWQHQAAFQTNWAVKNGMIFPLKPDSNFFSCWTSGLSTNILLGNSVNLSPNVIVQAPLAKFLKDDPRMDLKYSILVRQYPLDPESYKYWLSVQQNSQSLGGLSDLQPAQLKGNITSIINPNLPVIGYVSASSISEKRIFISNAALPGWQSNPPRNCPMDTLLIPDPVFALVYTFRDTSFTVYQFLSGSGNPPQIVVSKKACLDCRFQGGSIVKPSFWQ